MSERTPLIVLGAGLAGLSLADALLDHDPLTPMLLLDRRRRWTRDRTWCTWLTEPLRFAALATHHWSRWELARRGRRVIKHAPAHPYIHINSADLYTRVRARIAQSPNAQLRAGQSVRSVHRDRDGWIVETDGERLVCDRVVDAMGPGSPLVPAVDGCIEQRFVGWEIEADHDRFDPSCPVLMDFRGRVDGALMFFYVLPFTPRRALIEHTTIGGPGASDAARRDALYEEIDRRAGAGQWRTVFEERGRLPMAADQPRPRRAPGYFSAGAAAGCIRPSSGYAFTRTQRQVAELAAMLTGNAPAPKRSSPRTGSLDRLFLAALARASDGGEQMLWDMATRVRGDRFARFMSDSGSLADDLHVAATIPTLPLRLLAPSAIPSRKDTVT